MPFCNCCGDAQPEPKYKVGDRVLHPGKPKRYMKIQQVSWSHCYGVWFYRFNSSDKVRRQSLTAEQIEAKEIIKQEVMRNSGRTNK